MKSIILILGDQLNLNISALQNCDKENDLIVMCEVIKECTNPKHHKKKLVFILSAMRHFALELTELGFKVCYIKLDDPENTGSFASEVTRISQKYQIKNLLVTHPAEYGVLQELNSIKDIKLNILPDNRFLCDIAEFKEFAHNKANLIMESFYRYMRKKHNILMDKNNKPIGGKWNYDTENRNPAKLGLNIPKQYVAKIDIITRGVISLVAKNFADHFGDIKPFYLAVTRKEALIILDDFIAQRLENFGTYQDAMLENEDFMYHSHISFYLNNGLLAPLEVIQKVQKAYKEGNIALNSVEGFIRQILGWREYIRGIYWLKMPKYKELNFFNAKRNLPEFYWHGKTKMNCMKQSLRNTKENAYAHHIQRLMVLGNFALITALDPKQVNNWYLIVYADAYEWVELPNVSGMVLFADGGVLATKPYASSGAYINKMSNYCKNCAYLIKEKSGASACPFNYLYWNFLLENKDVLSNNHRMNMIFSILNKFSSEKIAQIKHDSKIFLTKISQDNEYT
jgi:deoxyribodipyrimidine photolyase-related protein